MTRKPKNGFPREGDHQPVTRPHLDKLKAARPVPNSSLDYTIGGGIEASVKATEDAKRIYAINRGERRLKQSSDETRQDHSFAVTKGQARGQFIGANGSLEEYKAKCRKNAKKARAKTIKREFHRSR